MANEITVFEQENLQLLKDLASVSKMKKELASQEDVLKKQLLPLMEEAGVVSIKNDYITISYVGASETVRIDTDAIKLDDPELYHKLMDKYNKRSQKRAYLRFSAK